MLPRTKRRLTGNVGEIRLIIIWSFWNWIMEIWGHHIVSKYICLKFILKFLCSETLFSWFWYMFSDTLKPSRPRIYILGPLFNRYLPWSTLLTPFIQSLVIFRGKKSDNFTYYFSFKTIYCQSWDDIKQVHTLAQNLVSHLISEAQPGVKQRGVAPKHNGDGKIVQQVRHLSCTHLIQLQSPAYHVS